MTSKQKAVILKELDFVYLPGGEVIMGTDTPLPCKIEGMRQNELPKRRMSVGPFWVSKYCVNNFLFERCQPKHFRPPTSLGDNQPVTDLTYGEVLHYVHWLYYKHGLDFGLPTEAEWTYAAAPCGWEYPYQKGPNPDKTKAHTFNREQYVTLNVDDSSLGYNCHGLYHVGGNVSEMLKEWYYTTGHGGAKTDGAYYVYKGGSFGNCHYSPRVCSRGITDIVSRSPRIGFRLVCHL